MLLRLGAEGVRPCGAGAGLPDAPGHLLRVEDAAVEAPRVRTCAGRPAVQRGRGARAPRGAGGVPGEGRGRRVWRGDGADDERGEGSDERGED